MTLHEAIEKVLKLKGLPLMPTQIADELNKTKLYSRGDNGKIPSGQISARVNNYPKYFYKNNLGQVCLVNWKENIPNVTEEIINVIPPKEIIINDDIEQELMDEGNFKQVSIAEKLIPSSPGLYCVRVSMLDNLPQKFAEEMKIRNYNIFYIGIASGSLKVRFLNQELRAIGHGTFFRSVGAMLGYLPSKGSLKNKANKKNYTFSAEDKVSIINWINDNLIVNWIELGEGIEDMETKLIVKYQPLLNLAGNPNPMAKLKELRAKCVAIANE